MTRSREARTPQTTTVMVGPVTAHLGGTFAREVPVTARVGGEPDTGEAVAARRKRQVQQTVLRRRYGMRGR